MYPVILMFVQHYFIGSKRRFNLDKPNVGFCFQNGCNCCTDAAPTLLNSKWLAVALCGRCFYPRAYRRVSLCYAAIFMHNDISKIFREFVGCLQSPMFHPRSDVSKNTNREFKMVPYVKEFTNHAFSSNFVTKSSVVSTVTWKGIIGAEF